MTKDDTLGSALSRDHTTAKIDDADHAMLAYVDKLTCTPAAMSADDVNELRRAGFDDAAILDICQVAAYFAFVNRLADGLGVELESPAP